MTDEIYPEPACECGAHLEEGQTRCRKCSARQRWIKKQAAKRRDGRRRGETRRPPRAARGLAAAGVIWS
ncbi:hypothetical protein [Nonomuraea cavernae]|uniref:Uncharacterized protein n=1 Tax=Nonomuraea cavernae TaxID=2045107 RepID=A0A917ZJE8_9ACTN|nr:hypothetical protein [Nonomuraea cavernae]MCA2191028.1 hypothetical protein [Nonomuraea cavernae]GGO83776.1 hypothetical protein GCM10012289_77930 [Nonomuraea cavernae]